MLRRTLICCFAILLASTVSASAFDPKALGMKIAVEYGGLSISVPADKVSGFLNAEAQRLLEGDGGQQLLRKHMPGVEGVSLTSVSVQLEDNAVLIRMQIAVQLEKVVFGGRELPFNLAWGSASLATVNVGARCRFAVQIQEDSQNRGGSVFKLGITEGSDLEFDADTWIGQLILFPIRSTIRDKAMTAVNGGIKRLFMSERGGGIKQFVLDRVPEIVEQLNKKSPIRLDANAARALLDSALSGLSIQVSPTRGVEVYSSLISCRLKKINNHG